MYNTQMYIIVYIFVYVYIFENMWLLMYTHCLSIKTRRDGLLHKDNSFSIFVVGIESCVYLIKAIEKSH